LRFRHFLQVLFISLPLVGCKDKFISSLRGNPVVKVAPNSDGSKKILRKMRCSSDEMPKEFEDTAVSLGLRNRADSYILYSLARKFLAPLDSVTLLYPSQGYIPTIAEAAYWVHVSRSLLEENSPGSIRSDTESTPFSAVYVEADVLNLGGLNNVLTNTIANEVLRIIAQTIKKKLTELPYLADNLPNNYANLCAIRHGGDEFSFILTSKEPIKFEIIQTAMEEARKIIAEFAVTTSPKELFDNTDTNSFVDSSAYTEFLEARTKAEKYECLNQIPHGKKPPNSGFDGTGFYYAIKEIPSTKEKFVDTEEAKKYFGPRVMLPAHKIINEQKETPQPQKPCKTSPQE
jgi:GGDEF domain-containing protein